MWILKKSDNPITSEFSNFIKPQYFIDAISSNLLIQNHSGRRH